MSNTDKQIDIYERLAAALDALPHGFPRTPSGVELRLIKMAFTPGEVSLAVQLSRTPETAAEIAKRVGLDVADVNEGGGAIRCATALVSYLTRAQRIAASFR